MAPSSVESARSGTTRMSEGSDSVGELEIQSSVHGVSVERLEYNMSAGRRRRSGGRGRGDPAVGLVCLSRWWAIKPAKIPVRKASAIMIQLPALRSTRTAAILMWRMVPM